MTDLLQVLFDLKPEESYLLIHTIPEQKSYFLKEPSNGLISKLKTNVYVGCGFHNKNQYIREDGKEGRGERKDIAGIFGLWADIDVKLEKNYFRKSPEIVSFLDRLPHKPTAVIQSGGGYQAWWLFKEAWRFENDEERDLAESYTKGWIDYLKTASEKDLDSVGDLTRILRIPGTLNYKYNPARNVKVENAEGGFYLISDFEPFINTAPKAIQASKPLIPQLGFAENLSRAAKALESINPNRADDYTQWLQVGMSLYGLDQFGLLLWKQWSAKSAKHKDGDCEAKWKSFGGERDKKITLGSLQYWKFEDNKKISNETVIPDIDATIDYEIIESLADTDPDFKSAWQRSRKKFEGDQYKYDCSLVSYGVKYGFNNQIICDLVISHRRKHNQNPAKACQPGYIDSLIDRARLDYQSDYGREQEIDEAETALKKSAELNNDSIKDALSKLFGCPIYRLTRSISDPPRYTLYLTPERYVNLGGINVIFNYALFRDKLAAETHKAIHKKLKLHWDQHAEMLLQIVEREDIGPEAHDIGRAQTWVAQYINETDITPANQTENHSQPFWHKGEAYVIAFDFRSWLNRNCGDRVSDVDFGCIMRKAGCEPKNMYKTNNKRGFKIRCWLVTSLIQPEAQPEPGFTGEPK